MPVTAKWRGARNRLMVTCALIAAAMLAAPAAMARGHYGGHGDHAGDVLGALVVGAVIGGVLVGATQHDNYDDDGYAYPSQPQYPPQGYDGRYTTGYAYPSYPAYPGGYATPAYGSVNVGVVYSSGYGHRSYDRGYYDRVRSRRDYRGSHAGHGGYGNEGYHGGGHYYSRHGH